MEPVTTWIMTEEERLAYIKKHPIKPIDKSSLDYKWRSEKATKASVESRYKW